MTFNYGLGELNQRGSFQQHVDQCAPRQGHAPVAAAGREGHVLTATPSRIRRLLGHLGYSGYSGCLGDSGSACVLRRYILMELGPPNREHMLMHSAYACPPLVSSDTLPFPSGSEDGISFIGQVGR
jgi:hypothetical protein